MIKADNPEVFKFLPTSTCTIFMLIYRMCVKQYFMNMIERNHCNKAEWVLVMIGTLENTENRAIIPYVLTSQICHEIRQFYNIHVHVPGIYITP